MRTSGGDGGGGGGGQMPLTPDKDAKIEVESSLIGKIGGKGGNGNVAFCADFATDIRC